MINFSMIFLFMFTEIFCCEEGKGEPNMKKYSASFISNAAEGESKFELLNSPIFSWERVFQQYLMKSTASDEEYKFFAIKIFSPLFRMLMIINKMFENLKIYQIMTNVKQEKTKIFDNIIYFLLGNKGDKEKKFALLTNFLYVHFTSDIENSKFTIQDFMNFFEKLCDFLNDNACICSPKIKEKNSCSCFQDIFGIQLQVDIDLQGRINLVEYGNNNIFIIHEKKICLSTIAVQSYFSSKNLKIPQTFTYKIIHFPIFIFVKSVKKSDFSGFWRQIIEFESKKYIVVGFLDYNTMKDDFNYTYFGDKEQNESPKYYNNESLVNMKVKEENLKTPTLKEFEVVLILKLLTE